MVGAVVDTGVVDTLKARLENARRRHEANEYGDLPWAVVEAGIRAVWATEHPSRPVSPRPMNTKGGVDAGVNAGGDQVGCSSQGNVGGRRSNLSPMSATHVIVGGIAPSYGFFKFTLERISVTPLLVGHPDILTWKEAIEPQLEMAGLIGFTRGIVATPEELYPNLRVEFRAVQLLTFTVISQCCSPGVQIALKSCKEHLDAGHRAWHFIESTYQVTDALYIGQLEEQLSHIRIGEEETATDYCNRARVSLFDHTSGASLAPPAIADSASRSQWLTRDAAADFAIRNHLSLVERAHFGQHKTAKALYDAVVARYSSPAIDVLGQLILPYLFPELSAFATVEDLATHLRTCDARYRSALPAEFLDKNPPPMYITLYFIVTHLPDSLRTVRDHFLALDPTDLTVDLLEQHLLAAETSVVAVGAACGTPRTPFFEGCSPFPLAPSYASAAAVDILGAEDVRAAVARARVAGVVALAVGVVVVAAVEVVEVAEVVAAVGVVAGVGALVAAVVAVVGVALVAAMGVVAAGVELFRGEVLAVARGSSSSVRARPLRLSSFVSGLLRVGRLGVVFAARMSFARVTVLVKHARSFTLSTTASPA
ncbi:unnamed protein product [Closterium sp. NIES-54]